MRPRLGWFRSRWSPAALMLGGVTLGCSLLLHDEAQQCSTDRDCDQLGLQGSTCRAHVCISTGTAGGGNTGGEAASGGVTSGVSGGGASHTSGTGGADQTGLAGEAGSSNGDAGAAPIPDWAELAPPALGIWIRVRSFCAQPLWISASGQAGPLFPDDTKLQAGDTLTLNARDDWGLGEVIVYGGAARGVRLHSFAVALTEQNVTSGIEYWDQYALPAEVVSFGGECSGANAPACTAREADVASCPESFLLTSGRCLAPSTYCKSTLNQDEGYCHALDSTIAECRACPVGSTYDVYASQGNYAGESRLVAALNRGMIADPDSTDSALFYEMPPYNTYARWLHGLCPSLTAFVNDDYGTTYQDYSTCDATEVRITLCPAR